MYDEVEEAELEDDEDMDGDGDALNIEATIEFMFCDALLEETFTDKNAFLLASDCACNESKGGNGGGGGDEDDDDDEFLLADTTGVS